MNYNAAMAAGTPGGGGMPFVMNRGGSYWLAPSQEQMDYMALSGSTVMAAGNGQVFSINNQGELILSQTTTSYISDDFAIITSPEGNTYEVLLVALQLLLIPVEWG